eukprot:4770019-Heterocapsa_arctica.AAC.1
MLEVNGGAMCSRRRRSRSILGSALHHPTSDTGIRRRRSRNSYVEVKEKFANFCETDDVEAEKKTK